FERKHSFLGVVTWPATAALEITGIGRLTAGTPYTPLVGGDINGDGSRNDRAFIYNPAGAPDTAIGNGMQRLLDRASAGARNCLEKQMGSIASRNSCRGPWQPSLDLQLNYRPAWGGLQRRLTMSLVTSNLLAGMDQLFHGTSNLRGWGQVVRPSTTLLSVRGFDPAVNRYIYTVNERFGATSAGTNAFRVPFQVGIQLRYTLGQSGIGALFGGFGGRGGGGGGGGGGEGIRGAARGAAAGGDFTNRFASLIPNPIKEILDLRIGLKLSDDQEKQLTVLSDTLVARNEVLARSLQTEMAKLGANPDGARLMTVIRPRMEEGQKQMQAALQAAKAILTAEQWNYLPERIRNPRGQRPGGAQRPVRPDNE
ncbi:MAG TPA: Spy/CpxP family protein refolding chaperone, partial [Gemmatimonadales bacterium]